METTNLSKLKRDKMLDTINQIKKNITDEETLNNLSLIENELTKKKYGLIWEEHEERVDKELETQIPTFEDVTERELENNLSKFNFLLEGDNLHSLYLLQKTHRNKIDVIYIDPPYNTGNKDFVYNDSYVDTEDSFRHSKWLSFMKRRLEIVPTLLSPKGIIFISIGDLELSNMKLLCDEIFGENNFIAIVPRLMKSGGNKGKFFSPNIDYILVYAKNVSNLTNFKAPMDEKIINKLYNNIETDGERKGQKYRAFGLYQSSLDSRPNQRYFIECPDGSLAIPPGKTMPINKIDGEKVLPDSGDGCWRWSADRYLLEKKQNNLVFKKSKSGVLLDENGNKSKWNVYTKIWLDARQDEGQTPTNFISEFENRHSAKELLKLDIDFDFAKPVNLIKYLIKLYEKQDDITILDFFAGSGTTGQAVVELNNEDNRNRNFILCTNNENKICENITYKRLKNVCCGTTNFDPIKFNLKYYKTSYIPKINNDDNNLHDNLLLNIKNLIQLENGIKIDGKSIKIYLNEKDLDLFTLNENELNECDKVYISSDILLTAEQEKVFDNYNIEVYIIPEYYFEDEIMEVA